MAIAAVGTTGSIVFAGSQTGLVNVRSWALTFSRPGFDTTPFAPTSNARTTLGGLVDIEGSAEIFLDSAAEFTAAEFNDPDTAAAAFTLKATDPTGVGNSPTYVFDGYITGFSPAVRTNSINTATISFVASGTNVTVSVA